MLNWPDGGSRAGHFATQIKRVFSGEVSSVKTIEWQSSFDWPVGGARKMVITVTHSLSLRYIRSEYNRCNILSQHSFQIKPSHFIDVPF